MTLLQIDHSLATLSADEVDGQCIWTYAVRPARVSRAWCIDWCDDVTLAASRALPGL